jgi:hypothetical protein
MSGWYAVVDSGSLTLKEGDMFGGLDRWAWIIHTAFVLMACGAAFAAITLCRSLIFLSCPPQRFLADLDLL